MASSGTSIYGSTGAAVCCLTTSNDLCQETTPLFLTTASKSSLNYSATGFARGAHAPEDDLLSPEHSVEGSSSSLDFRDEDGGETGQCLRTDDCPQVEPADSEPPSFWASFGGLIPEGISLTLHNSGSVARDHLASERTFLAYMRTSLAIASSGVALVQLFTAASVSSKPGEHRLHTFVLPLGATTVGLGLVVLVIGVVRYYSVQNALTKGAYPAARVATGFIAVMLTCLVTVTFAILLSGKLQPKRH